MGNSIIKGPQGWSRQQCLVFHRHVKSGCWWKWLCGQQKKRCFSLNKSSNRSVAMKLGQKWKDHWGHYCSGEVLRVQIGWPWAAELAGWRCKNSGDRTKKVHCVKGTEVKRWFWERSNDEEVFFTFRMWQTWEGVHWRQKNSEDKRS